jgi:SEC-C motif-containing protein
LHIVVRLCTITSVARPCPCTSGLDYRECCAPFHRCEREAPDAPSLVRARFAAFALGEVDYVWRTLDHEHDDRSRPREEVLRAIRESARTARYTRLAILDASELGDEARVLFRAGVFERGKDRSFVELSDFRRGAGAWRYLCGRCLAASRPDVAAATTMAAFDAIHT